MNLRQNTFRHFFDTIEAIAGIAEFLACNTAHLTNTKKLFDPVTTRDLCSLAVQGFGFNTQFVF